jgi:hypothetical protein
MSTGLINAFENIEPYGTFDISGMKVHHIAVAIRGNVVEHALGRRSMGIEKSRSTAGVNVLQEQIFHQPRLPGTWEPDNIHMPSPIFIGD